VPGGKADGARILGEIVKAQRPGVSDQQAQDPAPLRRVPDLQLDFVAHAVGDEPLEASAGGVDHPKCRVLRVGHMGRGLDDPFEDALERQLGADGDTGFDQCPEAVGPFPRGHAFMVSKGSVVSRSKMAGLPQTMAAGPGWRRVPGPLECKQPRNHHQGLEARDEHHHS